MTSENTANFIRNLPDPESAGRFLAELGNRFPAEEKRLRQNPGLFSDILTIVSFSPLLATTLLQHKSYFAWLDRQRMSAKVRGKDDLIESLARFAMTNSTLEPNVLLSRFRRRELLRIYLQDIRNLETIAEITEEISNLADAILEYALRLARQELDNRFGAPLETDEKGRSAPAGFCIVALGKLGSKELNYSSDIDLLFLYSSDGTTSGSGTRGAVTNREYFIKLAEHIIKLVGQQTGEGAAYRVDMRLRPHGRVGALAISAKEAAQYYSTTARPWERQVLIRSRACAGDSDLFRLFSSETEKNVFHSDETVANALRNVRLSKEKIDLEKQNANGYDVKLGRGGIREIEFIAQALQLAHAGPDEWLRAPHTLISLSRLADRGLISESEHTELADAYAFLRRLEHRLQMEHGLQTHLLVDDPGRKLTAARRMGFDDTDLFDAALERHRSNVCSIFLRVFGDADTDASDPSAPSATRVPESSPAMGAAISSINKAGIGVDSGLRATLAEFIRISPYFGGLISSNPELISVLEDVNAVLGETDFTTGFDMDLEESLDFAGRLAAIRKRHARYMMTIAAAEVFGRMSAPESKRAQSLLARATIGAALSITRTETAHRNRIGECDFPLAVMGLGKLGGDSMDYGSDLDIVLVYDDETVIEGLSDSHLTRAGYFGKAVEIFVTTLSSMTRDGSLYRVDLRLRPDGKNGPPATAKSAFFDYFEHRADVWELLAYVKLRGVSGDLNLAATVEAETRRILFARAKAYGASRLREESLRVRDLLEKQRAGRSRRETDIKYGAGGMLDVYFAMRYLQLLHGVADSGSERSTGGMLERLNNVGILAPAPYASFSEGYRFLSALDHQLRLTIGRSTKFPSANREALEVIARRMQIGSADALAVELTKHRLEIRSAYDDIFRDKI